MGTHPGNMCLQSKHERTTSDELNFDFLLATFSDDIDTIRLDDLDASSACEHSVPNSSRTYQLSEHTDFEEELLQIDLDTLVDLTKPLISSPVICNHLPHQIPMYYKLFTSHHQSSAPSNSDVLQASSAQSATPGSTRLLDAESEQRVSQRPPKRARSQMSFKCQQQLWSQWTNTGEVREVDYTCSYCSRVKPHLKMKTVQMQCECGGQSQDNTPRSHNCWLPSADLGSAMLTDINDSMQQPCRPVFTWVDHKVEKPAHALPSTAVKFKFSPVSNSDAISGKSSSKRHAKWALNHAKPHAVACF